METSLDTASSKDDNGTTPSSSSSSPPSESLPETSAQSPPPPSASPPPTVESPPSPPPPSTTPKASSPVPSTTNTPSQSSPPPSITDLPAISNHTSPEILFSPPTQSPPSPAGKLPRPSPSRESPSEKPSGGSSGNNNNDSDSSSLNVIIVGGVAVAGLLLLAFVIICLLCKKKKKRHHYYMDSRRPPKGSDPYYNGNNQWNSPKPKDHIVKLHPPPGIMGTPLVGGGGGWAPSNLGYSNGEFGSGFVGQQALTPASPNMGGYGGFSKSQFTYEELAAATSGFSQDNLLGQGGFGYVHKGVLTDGKVVAVKSLKSGSGQGEREFQAEVEIISRVHHRHLVSLVGYCMAEGQRLLVYEYVSNKTLEFHLHGKGRPPMDWGTKLKIALGSAKGLAYLHEDCHPRIIHRDIKAANILLDDNFEAMVADFGLAKLSSDNHTHVSTRVMGTFGYMAPEYASSGKLTEKSDVFSFGVMLLELITGRRPVDPTNKFMEDSLVDWARPLLAKALEEGTFDDLLDVPLQGNVVPSELRRLVACAAASIRHSAKRRPRMSQIVRALDGDSSLEDLNNGNKPSKTATFSTNAGVESYDTGAYNADIMKFRKMVMPSQEFNSSDYGGTSEYGLNPSSSSSDSRESGHSGGRG